jgi:hypothetical protein
MSTAGVSSRELDLESEVSLATSRTAATPSNGSAADDSDEPSFNGAAFGNGTAFVATLRLRPPP